MELAEFSDAHVKTVSLCDARVPKIVSALSDSKVHRKPLHSTSRPLSLVSKWQQEYGIGIMR